MQAVLANSNKLSSWLLCSLSQRNAHGLRSRVSLILKERKSTSINFGARKEYERVRFDCWPSVEHAAFAFAKLSSKGSNYCKTTVELQDFVDVITEMNLNFNLSRVEIERVFHQLDKNGDGQLSLEEFKNGRSNNPFVKSLVEALSGADRFDNTYLELPDKNFDWKMSTEDFYQAPLARGFVGEYVTIRESLDYEYHKNYIHKRQLFQDALIRKNVLLAGSKTDRPWLVYTCGPMGAGKGWVLGWLSVNGILPLEEVSKIDPDTFKLRMPEWPIYQAHGHQVAGSMTHPESSYIAEIAMHVAMNNSMNVWVDGSLRNFEWHAEQFDEIRRKWPQYRIAILAIGARESTIRCRLEHRAKETGRYVPKNIQIDSVRGFQDGLRHLTRKVDLIASVFNDNSGADTAPELEFVSMIDRSGNWDLIKSLTNFQGNGST